MKMTFSITIYEALFLLFTIGGGIFALLQWKQKHKLERANFLNAALTKIRDDKEFASVLYAIDYGEQWYTNDFITDHLKEQQFDRVFAYFDYLCYLKDRHILSKKEFQIFEYRIVRMANSDSFMSYMFNLYHFSKRNGTRVSFCHLLMYLKKSKLLEDSFWNVNSSEYTKLLNI